MKKLTSIMLFVIIVFFCFAYADVVTMSDGYYNLFDKEIGYTTTLNCIMGIIAAIMLVILIVLMFVIKSKKKRIIAIVSAIVIYILFAIGIPYVIPTPRFNHGRLVGYIGYNQQYQYYFGDNLRYAEVNTVIDMVNAHNMNDVEVSKYGTISITGNGIEINEENGIYDISEIDKRMYFSVWGSEYYPYSSKVAEPGSIKTIEITAYDSNQNVN